MMAGEWAIRKRVAGRECIRIRHSDMDTPRPFVIRARESGGGLDGRVGMTESEAVRAEVRFC